MNRALLTIIAILVHALITGQTVEDKARLAAKEMNSGNYKEAIELFQQAIDLIPDETSHAITFAYAGMCAQEAGELDIAKSYFIEAINRGMVETMVYDALANIAKEEKDYATQIMAYKAGVEHSPADKEKYLIKLCGVYKKKKDAENLIITANAILETDKTHLKALEYKGTGQQYNKDMPTAKLTFEELYSLDSSSINANIFLGNYYYQVGKKTLDASRKEYDKIVKPTRVQWHEENEKNRATMATYFRPSIKHLEYVYSQKKNSNIEKMLFAMYTKLGENEKAAPYKAE